jgi:hypothetical protein
MGHIDMLCLFVYLSHRPIYEVLKICIFNQNIANILLGSNLFASNYCYFLVLQKWYNDILLFFTPKSVTLQEPVALVCEPLKRHSERFSDCLSRLLRRTVQLIEASASL